MSESLSVPAMVRSKALAHEPLVHAVLTRLLADEGPHSRLGFWFLDWASEQLTDEERVHLATLCVDTVKVYAPLWQSDDRATCPLPLGLGGHDAIGRAALEKAVDVAIATPLARYGIELDRARLAAYL